MEISRRDLPMIIKHNERFQFHKNSVFWDIIEHRDEPCHRYDLKAAVDALSYNRPNRHRRASESGEKFPELDYRTYSQE
jgi:hypothetical protein